MYLFFDIPPTQSCSFSFITSLPLSFFWYLSHTLFLCTSFKPLLSLSIYLSLSLAQSLFYSPYRYYFVIVSPYLSLSLSLTFSLFGATSDYSSLYLRDIIPLLLSFLLWYDYHNHCFIFVLIIIIFLLVLLLANMKINILEKSLFSISHEFLYFFMFAYPPCTYSW